MSQASLGVWSPTWSGIPNTPFQCLKASSGMSASNERLQRVLARIDAANEQDPRTVEVDGVSIPYEKVYSEWLTDWVRRLEPMPSEELLIAARGQHIQRWLSPRSSYPDGRQAYLKWREDLKKMHAEKVVSIMQEEGYQEESTQKVRQFILKRSLKTDEENQVLEDALCLVFLQRQFAEFRLNETEDKMVDIIRKTWKKMGERGRAAALQLPLGDAEAALVGRALAPAADQTST